MLGSVCEAEDIVQDAVVSLAGHRSHGDSGRAGVPGDGGDAARAQRRPVRARAPRGVCGSGSPSRSIPAQIQPSARSTARHSRWPCSCCSKNSRPQGRAARTFPQALHYEYERIADTQDERADTCVQLVSRARRHVVEGRRKPVSSAQKHQRLLPRSLPPLNGGRVGARSGLRVGRRLERGRAEASAREAPAIPIVRRGAVAKFVATVTASILDWSGSRADRGQRRRGRDQPGAAASPAASSRSAPRR